MPDSAPIPSTCGYGTAPTRWVRPVLLAVALVAFDEQGIFALLLGFGLILIYLPRTLLAKKLAACRKERLIRLSIYLSAVVATIVLFFVSRDIAEQRAERLVAAIEHYHKDKGSYPEQLDQLVPQFIPEIPAQARPRLMDTGFRYASRADGHALMYVVMPPFGRRIYSFERRAWSTLD